MSTETITARYKGRCNCGATFRAGDSIDYNAEAPIGSRIVACGACRSGSPATEPDATDMAYEDQCAEICGR